MRRQTDDSDTPARTAMTAWREPTSVDVSLDAVAPLSDNISRLSAILATAAK